MAEENTLKLQQIVCPSCNRPINTFNPQKLMTECPFCHSKLLNPLVKPKTLPAPERIIPFSTDEKTFENSLINALVNQDYVPTDIFESIDTGDVFQAYLPTYLYEGFYNASWSCESAYKDQVVSVDNNNKVTTRDVKKWRPQNGNASGNFAFLCLANEGSEIPEELRAFTRSFPYDAMMSKEFDPELIDIYDENLMTLERNADPTLVWQKHGKEMVEETAKKAALVQVGNQEVRNFRTSSSHNLTTTGRYVLAPFWFVYYTYGGKKYHFLMDGTGQRNEYSYPVNQEESDFVKKKENINKYMKWLWILAIVIALADVTTGLVFLGIWWIAKLIVKKSIEKKIRERLDQSRSLRQSAANKL